MYRNLLSFCLSVTAVVAAAAIGTTPSPKRRQTLQEDPRLTKRLVVESEPIALGKLIRALHDQTSVDLSVQGEIFRRPVSIQVSDRSARLVMEDLATIFGGTWVRRESAYLLVTDEALLKLIGTQVEGGTAEIERALMESFTEVQLAALRRHGRCSWLQLQPEQQGLVRSIVTNRYLSEPARYPSSLLRCKGVEIQLPQGRRPILLIAGPVVNDDGQVEVNPIVVLTPTTNDNNG